MSKNGQIKGFDKLIKKLEDTESDLYKDIDNVTEGVAQEIADLAKNNAPINMGNLQQSIQVVDEGGLSYKVVVNAEYGAYVEFGTGKKVNVPTELKDQAEKFKGGNGSFKEGLQSIKDWCRAKGIPEEAAYPILISLITNGQRPQPYLYPAWVKGKKLYIEDLKDILNKEFNNI